MHRRHESFEAISSRWLNLPSASCWAKKVITFYCSTPKNKTKQPNATTETPKKSPGGRRRANQTNPASQGGGGGGKGAGEGGGGGGLPRSFDFFFGLFTSQLSAPFTHLSSIQGGDRGFSSRINLTNSPMVKAPPQSDGDRRTNEGINAIDHFIGQPSKAIL